MPSKRWTPDHNFAPIWSVRKAGQIGQGNIVIHQNNRPRYKCKTCGRTFSARAGTALEGIRYSEDDYVKVITLLAYGTSIQAIVHAFGINERTVAKWRDRAGIHCEAIHKEKVERGILDLIHVQADAHLGKNERSSYLGSISDNGTNTLMDCRRGK